MWHLDEDTVDCQKAQLEKYLKLKVEVLMLCIYTNSCRKHGSLPMPHNNAGTVTWVCMISFISDTGEESVFTLLLLLLLLKCHKGELMRTSDFNGSGAGSL